MVSVTCSVSPNVTATETIMVCEDHLPYSWNSQSLKAAEAYKPTFTTSNGYDSVVTLTFNVNPNVTATETITVCEDQLPYTWNSQSLTAAGTYNATLTTSNGCDSVVTLTFNVNPNVTSTENITI